MGLVFGLYILNAFGDMLGEETIDLITPFKHFDPGYIISNVAYYVPQAYISVVLIIISFVASYLLYTRRDIPSAV
jgi:ABC-2 type transport system permease protein